MKQVAQDGAAGLVIRVDADELSPLVGGADGPFGQHPADGVGLLILGRLQPLENLFLARVIAGDGKGHELIERHAVVGIDIEQGR